MCEAVGEAEGKVRVENGIREEKKIKTERSLRKKFGRGRRAEARERHCSMSVKE